MSDLSIVCARARERERKRETNSSVKGVGRSTGARMRNPECIGSSIQLLTVVMPVCKQRSTDENGREGQQGLEGPPASCWMYCFGLAVGHTVMGVLGRHGASVVS